MMPGNSLTCNLCNLTFTKKSSLQAHHESHLSYPAKCEDGDLFDDFSLVYKHTLCDEEEEYESSKTVDDLKKCLINGLYKCNICNKQYKRQDFFINHMKTHDSKFNAEYNSIKITKNTKDFYSKKLHACTKCNKTFKTKHNLEKHKSVHLQKGPFKCLQCGKKFLCLSYYTNHMKIHENEQLCDKKLQQPSKRDYLNSTQTEQNTHIEIVCSDGNESDTTQIIEMNNPDHEKNIQISTLPLMIESSETINIMNDPSNTFTNMLENDYLYSLSNNFEYDHINDFFKTTDKQNEVLDLQSEFISDLSFDNTMHYQVKSELYNNQDEVNKMITSNNHSNIKNSTLPKNVNVKFTNSLNMPLPLNDFEEYTNECDVPSDIIPKVNDKGNVACEIIAESDDNGYNIKNEILANIEQNQREIDSLISQNNILKNSDTSKKIKSSVSNKYKVKVKKSYICQVCNKDCKTSSKYHVHMRYHTGERPYYCNICNAGFKQLSHLKSHALRHTQVYPYKCEVCSKGFIQSTSLKTHMKTHRNSKKKDESTRKSHTNFYCKICDKPYIGVDRKHHLMKHVQDKLKCNFCDFQGENKTKLKNHYLTYHSNSNILKESPLEYKAQLPKSVHDNKKPKKVDSESTKVKNIYFCKTCHSSFHDLLNFKHHMFKHKKVKPYMCSICNKLFGSKLGVKKHSIKIHKHLDVTVDDVNIETIKGFSKCVIVKKESNTNEKNTRESYEDYDNSGNQDNLVENDFEVKIIDRNGKNTEEVVDECPYDDAAIDFTEDNKCNGIETRSKSVDLSFLFVEKLDNGDLKFICNMCENIVLLLEDLWNHYLLHVDIESGLIDTPCPISYCKLFFSNPSDLEYHILNFHNLLNILTCENCSEAFNSKTLLLKHYRTSCIYTSFKCSKCKRVFSDKMLFRIHKCSKSCSWHCEKTKFSKIKVEISNLNRKQITSSLFHNEPDICLDSY